MKNLIKNNLILLFIGLLAMPNLVAQTDEQEDGKLSLSIEPKGEVQGRFYLAGEKAEEGDAIIAHKDRFYSVVNADYDNLVGVKVGIEGYAGDHDKGNGVSDAIVMLGESYVYMHILDAMMGLDQEKFDLYLQGGMFEVGLSNGRDAGQDKWAGDISGDFKMEYDYGTERGVIKNVVPNMQLDMKILDMLTVRLGMSLHDFQKPIYTSPEHLNKVYDMGAALLFDKEFGMHHISASIGYKADLSNNEEAAGISGKKKNKQVGSKYKNNKAQWSDDDDWVATGYEPQDFDQFGFSLAYTASLELGFAALDITPMFNFGVQGLSNSQPNAYKNPKTMWSAGLLFGLKDPDEGYNLVSLGIDMGGDTRENEDYTDALHGKHKRSYVDNTGFRGIGVKVWTDALRSVMGERYLSAWVGTRMEFWEPDYKDWKEDGVKKHAAEKEVERQTPLSYLGFGVEQRLVNKPDRSASIWASLEIKNPRPFKQKGTGWGSYGGGKFDPSNDSTDVYMNLGLKASFKAKFNK